jgi:hypothetical protein
MRIPMRCSECAHEELVAEEARDEAIRARGETPAPRPAGRPLRPEDWYVADIEEDNAYVEKCRKGHTMKMALQNVRYDVLYESGIVATLVGFHREAVSSIAASLERFYEFAIEVFTLRAGVELAAYELAWKHVKKQSERQFGAFLLLYLVTFKKPFLESKALNMYDDAAKFRNDVIHQGRFPSQTETLAYARYVYELIRDTRSQLKALDADAVQKIELRHTWRGHTAIEKKAGPPTKGADGLYRGASSAAFPTMLTTMMSDQSMEFDARLANSKANMWLWGFPS